MTFHSRHLNLRLLLGSLLVLLMAGCAPTRFIPEDQWMLDKVAVRTDNSEISATNLSGYVRQRPNSKWFSLFKVPMGVYCISGRDSTKRINRFFRRIGEAPVMYDSIQAERGRADMEAAVRNLGFLQAQVKHREKRHKRRIQLTFQVESGPRYVVRHIDYCIDDSALADYILQDTLQSLLFPGMPFDANVLN